MANRDYQRELSDDVEVFGEDVLKKQDGEQRIIDQIIRSRLSSSDMLKHFQLLIENEVICDMQNKLEKSVEVATSSKIASATRDSILKFVKANLTKDDIVEELDLVISTVMDIKDKYIKLGKESIASRAARKMTSHLKKIEKKIEVDS